MQDSGRAQEPRGGDPVRAAEDEGRAFSRRIDCDDTGRERRAVNRSPKGGGTREPPRSRRSRRRLDTD